MICVPTRPKHRQARMVEFGVPFQPPRQEPSNSANVAGHGTGPVADQLADMCRGSVGGSHAITAITALRCRVEPYLDQGGACGAAGPALAPASGLREAPAVARRATPLGQQIKAAHLRAGHTADSRLPRRTSVQLAVAARQGRPFGAVAKAIGFSRPWTRRPLTRISAYRGRREQSRQDRVYGPGAGYGGRSKPVARNRVARACIRCGARPAGVRGVLRGRPG